MIVFRGNGRLSEGTMDRYSSQIKGNGAHYKEVTYTLFCNPSTELAVSQILKLSVCMFICLSFCPSVTRAKSLHSPPAALPLMEVHSNIIWCILISLFFIKHFICQSIFNMDYSLSSSLLRSLISYHRHYCHNSTIIIIVARLIVIMMKMLMKIEMKRMRMKMKI
jgi:hypothetical protein